MIHPPVTFSVEGEIVGQQRARVTRNGTYTPKKTVTYKQIVQYQARRAMLEVPLFEGPVVLKIIAQFPIPDSWSAKKKERARAGTLLPTVKPDFDNIAKLVADSLNQICYLDDKQVVGHTIWKVYGDTPLVMVSVSEPVRGAMSLDAAA